MLDSRSPSRRGLHVAHVASLAFLACALWISSPGAESADPAAPSSGKAPGRFQTGVCWVGTAHRESLEYLESVGVSWISVTPFAYGQETHDAPPPRGFLFSRFPGESIDGVRAVIREAHRVGLRVLLCPHVWFLREDGRWRGDIAMPTEESWAEWFRMYREFLDPFLKIAREERVALFCVATELGGTAAREAEWRSVIAHCRSRYPGKLTYGANWHDEYKRVAFWSALDYVGIQAYFPLEVGTDRDAAAIARAWEPWKRELAAFAERSGRPILYTEFGYRPVADNLARPWEWSGGDPDTDAQARAYEGGFRAHAGAAWLAGIYVWKWFSPYTGADSLQPRRRRGHDGFSPQARPAESVMAEWFRKWNSAEPKGRVR